MSSFVPIRTDLQPVDWSAIDDAIFDWIVQTLEFNDSQVIKEQQNISQPDYPYVSFLRQSAINEGGIDEKRYRTLDADDRVVGEDPLAGVAVTNEETVYQPITFTVTIQAHVDFDNGSTNSGANAYFMCSKLKQSINLSSVNDTFNNTGISVARTEAVQNLNIEINGDWIDRAAVDIIFRTASVMSERTGFIEKVGLQSNQLGVDEIIDAS